MYQPDRPIAEFIKWPEGRVEHALANLRASVEIKYAIQAGDTELESLAGERSNFGVRSCFLMFLNSKIKSLSLFKWQILIITIGLYYLWNRVPMRIDLIDKR